MRCSVAFVALACCVLTACAVTEKPDPSPPDTSPAAPEASPSLPSPAASPLKSAPAPAKAPPKPPPKPAAVRPKPKPPAPKAGVYYENCAEAKAAGVAPLRDGEPGYRMEMNRDDDGVACE